VRAASLILPVLCSSFPGCTTVTPQNQQDGAAQGTAKDACDLYVATLCTTMGDCEVGAGQVAKADGQAYYDNCVKTISQLNHCDHAVGVSPGYQQCLYDVQALDCATVVSALTNDSNFLPNSCELVIAYVLNDGST
jgi:hypothetical protein